MLNAFAAKPSLRAASRLPSLSGDARLSLAEVACLLACGSLAALAVGMVRIPLGIPGHAILRGVLPMALGLAVVPRRSAGMIMSLGAVISAGGLVWGGLDRFQPAALLSILALGPVLDIAVAGRPTGWRLYLRLAAAGAVANLMAFALRFGMAFSGWQLAGSRHFLSFASLALLSFMLCGAVAGLVSAAIWFRLLPSSEQDHDLRRN
jgi:hypothetical protein